MTRRNEPFVFPSSSWWTTTLLAVGSSAILVGASLSFQRTPSDGRQEDPEQLIRDAVANEVNAEQNDHSLWRHRQIRQRGDNSEQLEFVGTRDGEIHRLLDRDGHLLTPQQLNKEDARINALLANPERFRQRARKEAQDAKEEQHLLKMLPTAFRYHYAGCEGNLIQLDFTPNLSFKPQRYEDVVFHHVQGSIWIDSSQKRIVRIQGQLISEVRFGGGILGYLAQGGTFVVEQRDVGDGHWELTCLNVNIDGKALFFKTINVRHNELDSDFTPVPRNITLQQAAELLKQVASSAPEVSVSAKQN
jgi:hypothetical protein